MFGRKLNCISLKTPRSDLLQIHKRLSTHSSVLAWRIPGTGQPSALPSMGSHRVGHDWSDLAAAAAARGSLSLLFFPELSTTLGNLVKTWVGSNSYSHQLAFSVTENVKSDTCFPRLLCKEGWLEKSADAGGKFLGFFFSPYKRRGASQVAQWERIHLPKQIQSLVGKDPLARKWQPTPVFLPGKFRGQRNLVGYSLWGRKESDTIEHTRRHKHVKGQEDWRNFPLRVSSRGFLLLDEVIVGCSHHL